MGTSPSKPARIEVRVPTESLKQERELGAFARYCVQRIEKDIGERQHWTVEIGMRSSMYTAYVEVQHFGQTLDARGEGSDGPLAIWDAMCRLEQELRERRAAQKPRPAVAND